jgi:hypothetical protein
MGDAMESANVIDRLDGVAREFAKQRTPDGTLVPGILRIPRSDLTALGRCGRRDWQAHNWAMFDRDLQALQGEDTAAAAAALKRLLNQTGVAVIGAEVVEEGALEIEQVFVSEVSAFLREFPRLLAEGHAGRYAVIHGDQVVSLCDTYADAVQHGYEHFGAGRFMAQRIDAREGEQLAVWLQAQESPCPS